MLATGRRGKWLTAIPLAYTEYPGYWERDGGLMCLGLQALGIESKFVALGDPETRSPHPLILATLEQMKDEHWWRRQEAEGVMIYSRGAPRFEPIVRAIKAAGLKLVVHIDSDGFSSPHVSFRDFLFGTYIMFRDERKPLPGLMALAKALLFRIFPQIYDLKFQLHLSHADIVTVNSPLGLQHMRRLLLRFNRPELAAKLRQIPAPSRGDCDYDPAVQKRPQIIAVGRWNTYQKDAPRLIASLNQVLLELPHYRAVVIGAGGDLLRQLIRDHASAVAGRIEVPDFIDRAALIRCYQESQIMFVPSRAESLHLAAVEALFCGCSVVGAAAISSMQWFTSRASGTAAPRRTVDDFSKALLAEAECWRKGERDPAAISRDWRSRVLAPVVVQTILDEVDALDAARSAVAA